jgi:hypothetical protein
LGISSVFAQANKLETAKRVEQTNKLVKPIEADAKTIEDFVEKEEKPHIVIADVSDYNKDKILSGKNTHRKPSLNKHARRKNPTRSHISGKKKAK